MEKFSPNSQLDKNKRMMINQDLTTDFSRGILIMLISCSCCCCCCCSCSCCCGRRRFFFQISKSGLRLEKRAGLLPVAHHRRVAYLLLRPNYRTTVHRIEYKKERKKEMEEEFYLIYKLWNKAIHILIPSFFITIRFTI